MPNKRAPNSQSNQDPNYSWKGSPNAGFVLTIAAALLALTLLAAGFAQ